jgi:hypothetical protein
MAHRLHEVTDGADDRGKIEMDYGEVKHVRAFQKKCGFETHVMMPLHYRHRSARGCDVDHTFACNQSALACETS